MASARWFLSIESLDQLKLKGKRVQNVLEVVGNAGGHLTQCAKFFASGKRIVRRPKLGVRLGKLLNFVGAAERDCGQIDEPHCEGTPVRSALLPEEHHHRTEESASADERMRPHLGEGLLASGQQFLIELLADRVRVDGAGR